MFKLLPAFFAFTLAACSAQTPTNSTTTNLEADTATLRDVKKIKWRKLYYDQDADGLAEFLADDFVLIANDNFGSKEREVDWLRNNAWAGPDDFLYTIEDIIFITDDAAIIYGRGTSTRADDNGTPCTHSYISSNTLRRDGDKWHPVSSHVSDAKCEPIS